MIFQCFQKHKQELKYQKTEVKLGIPLNVEKSKVENILSSNTMQVFRKFKSYLRLKIQRYKDTNRGIQIVGQEIYQETTHTVQ